MSPFHAVLLSTDYFGLMVLQFALVAGLAKIVKLQETSLDTVAEMVQLQETDLKTVAEWVQVVPQGRGLKLVWSRCRCWT